MCCIISEYIYFTSPTADGISNPNAHRVQLSSTGQGEQYFSADNNNYYLTFDTDNNIKVLPASEVTSVSLSHYSYSNAACLRLYQSIDLCCAHYRLTCTHSNKRILMMVWNNWDTT